MNKQIPGLRRFARNPGYACHTILITLAMLLPGFTAMASEVPVAAMRQVIGIVEMPLIFGMPDPLGPPGARLQAIHAPVLLYNQAKTGSTPIATVTAHGQIDTAEYTYEESGALVYGQEGGWYLIGLHSTSGKTKAWLRSTDAGRFHPLFELLKRGPSYFTSEWGNRLWLEPASGQTTMIDTTSKAINVIATREIGDQTWIEAEVLEPGHCEGPPPKVIARGWAPAHSPSGNMNAWFYSRGC